MYLYVLCTLRCVTGSWMYGMVCPDEFHGLFPLDFIIIGDAVNFLLTSVLVSGSFPLKVSFSELIKWKKCCLQKSSNLVSKKCLHMHNNQ